MGGNRSEGGMDGWMYTGGGLGKKKGMEERKRREGRERDLGGTRRLGGMAREGSGGGRDGGGLRTAHSALTPAEARLEEEGGEGRRAGCWG